MEKRVVETLIKPVVYEDFWVPFPQKLPKSIKKIIRFISKTERDFAESKNLIKPCKNQYFTKTENAL